METQKSLILRVATAFCLLFAASFVRGVGLDGGTPTLCGTYLFSEGNDNYKAFVVNVPASGRYYCNFWLFPSEKVGGKFTEYKVFINDEFAGDVIPVEGGAQQAAMDGVPAVMLDVGTNVITLSTPNPEVPNVEMVRLSTDADSAQISSSAYDAYLEKAEQGESIEEPKGLKATARFGTVPLKYSYYQLFSFAKDEEVSFCTLSNKPHAIDLFLYGKTPQMSVIDPSLLGNLSGSPAGGTNWPLVTSPESVAKKFYIVPSTDEMQGLSWKRNSEPGLNQPGTHFATMNIKIPKTGVYMVKLRSAENGVLGVCTITINDMFRSNNAPIYFSSISDEIPADTTAYIVYAEGLNPEVDDPMFFVQGNAADRIVGCNDDAPSGAPQELGLYNHDSYLCQAYKVKTSGVHVCNYSFSNPESMCFVGICREADLSAAQNQVAMQRSLAPARVDGGRMGVSGRVQECSISDVLSVASDAKRVQVFSLTGAKVASFGGERCMSGIPVSDFSSGKGGIYIVVTETEHGVESRKVFVK